MDRTQAAVRLMAKMTPEVKQRLIEGIRLGLSNKLAAQYAGISERTFYYWLEQARDGDNEKLQLLQDIKRAEAQSAAHALATIKKAAQEGTWTAAAWMLERRHGYRREPIEPEVIPESEQLGDPNTKEGRAQIIEHVSELPEEIIIAALNRRSVVE